MIKIPSSFKVFASTINVNFDSKRLSNEGSLGDCSYINGEISICKKYRGQKISKSCMADTFYHEKVHIILDAMSEHKLSENEKFVETFARLLRQSDYSAKF